MDLLFSFDAWISFLTLTFLEIVLGIDNIIFISILANKLPKKKRVRITNYGLFFAMLQRIILLFFISFLIRLNDTIFSIDTPWLSAHINWQSIILFFGGVFLIYKSTSEMYEKVEHKPEQKTISKKATNSFSIAILQILLIDFIFSIDSILTAIGMTRGISDNPNDALILMISAVIVSIFLMMLCANPIRRFIGKHPSIQVLGLAFLILIGVMLIIEASHSMHAYILDSEITPVPKGYLYFAITFSLFIEFLNIRINKSS